MKRIDNQEQTDIQKLADKARTAAMPKKPINSHQLTMKREDWLLNEIATVRRAPKGKADKR